MMNKNNDECLSIQFVFAEYCNMSGFWAAKRQPEAVTGRGNRNGDQKRQKGGDGRVKLP